MRVLGFLIASMLPGAALAEPVVVRVEAQQTATAEAMIERWAGRFPDAVTFPLPAGWTGVGLGPLEREEAQALLRQLRAERRIPADSFIVPVPEGLQPIRAAAGDEFLVDYVRVYDIEETE